MPEDDDQVIDEVPEDGMPGWDDILDSTINGEVEDAEDS